MDCGGVQRDRREGEIGGGCSSVITIHFHESMKVDGVVLYDELLWLTDPAVVTFEMDCGWVKVGGAGSDRVYLREEADRISTRHAKGFKAMAGGIAGRQWPVPAELGQGTMDMRRGAEGGDAGKIKHALCGAGGA